MCQINSSSSYNFAPESDAIRRMREQLSHEGSSSSKQSSSVIKDPQLDAVKQLMERISLGQL
jgi:hypothetical protein